MKAVTAMKLLHDLQGRKSRLSFGCPVLDQVSGGGIPLGGKLFFSFLWQL
jgi:hypothetical protein